MPLPENDRPWPPHELAKPYADMLEHAAWYSSDKVMLAKAYGRFTADDRRPSERRWFWGRSNAPSLGQPDRRLHVPLAADIATTSADLLFSEPPTFEIAADEGGAATQDRLDVILDDGGVINRALEAAEVSAALGGVFLKADWDLDLAKHPLLGVVHADAAIPEFRWGRLTACTFWREVRNDGAKVWRYLERHAPGAVEVGLYEGTKDNLGRVIPLNDRDAPAWVKQIADGLTDGNVKQTGVPMLTCTYIPNMRPNRKFRGSDLGRSDFQGVTDLFDALDETWTSWMRDLRLGRGRLVVPDSYLQPMGKGQGADFDADREVYSALTMPPTGNAGAANLTLTQFEIRVEQHAKTAQELVARAVAVAGYSGQTFGLVGDVAATATEVTARERKSFITRDKKTRYFRPELAAMCEVLLALDVALKTAPSGVTPSRPTVTFPDGVSEDPTEVATTLDLLNRAAAMSTQVKVERLHPDWDEKQIAAEVGRIHAEQGMNVPPPEAGPQLDDLSA